MIQGQQYLCHIYVPYITKLKELKKYINKMTLGYKRYTTQAYGRTYHNSTKFVQLAHKIWHVLIS